MKKNIKSIALLGWNENTVECLLRLVRSSLKPNIIIIPNKFNSKKLFLLGKKLKIETIKINKESSLLPYLKKCDIVVSASWPYIIQSEMLQYFHGRILNVHASLLPKYRGQHPLNWALLNDEKKIGVTIHLVSEELDAGNILIQKSINIKDEADMQYIRKKIHSIGAKLLVESIKKFKNLQSIPQDSSLVSNAPKRAPSDGYIQWKKTAREIFCLIRATSHPGPGAYAFKDGKKIIIWKTLPTRKFIKRGIPGEIISTLKKSFLIKCGNNELLKIFEYKGAKPKIGQILK